jgi:hypothetical protein
VLEVLGLLSNQAKRIFQDDKNTPKHQTRVGSKQDLPF